MIAAAEHLQHPAVAHQHFGDEPAPSPRKTLLKLRLLPRWLTSSDFRLAFTSGVSANSVCFERELLDHYRLVFEKQGGMGAGGFEPPTSRV